MALVLSWLSGFLLVVMITRGDKVVEKRNVSDRSPFSIEHIENSAELVANVLGVDKPVCFNIGSREEAVRLLQDPTTGVVLNGQLYYNSSQNLTYLGAVLLAQDGFSLLASQFAILVKNVRFNWGEVRVLDVEGHKVVISHNMIMVTFGHCRITLVIQRHFSRIESSMDYNELDREAMMRLTPANESQGSSREVTDSYSSRPLIRPVIGFRHSVVNSVLSSKRRRGLLLQQFFGVNEDSAVVRDVMIQVDSDARKKRNPLQEESGDSELDSAELEDTEQQVPSAWTKMQPVLNDISDSGQQGSGQPIQADRPSSDQPLLQPSVGRSRREMSESFLSASTGESMEERESGGGVRDGFIFLDVYLVDSRDFSNRTHGLLGQFLFKNATLEKIRHKEGRTTARLLLQDQPTRRTQALYSSRHYAAMNASRVCWKLRQQGREALDGKFTDYLLPNLWYRSMKELPPPAPL